MFASLQVELNKRWQHVHKVVSLRPGYWYKHLPAYLSWWSHKECHLLPCASGEGLTGAACGR